MPDVVHVSSLAGSPLLDSSGERLGKIEDVVARLEDGAAPVIGFTARIGGREMFVPIEQAHVLGPFSVGARVAWGCLMQQTVRSSAAARR